jgi:hypothetical protein
MKILEVFGGLGLGPKLKIQGFFSLLGIAFFGK